MDVRPLTADEIAPQGPELPPQDAKLSDILRQHGFHEKTPLWYYILKEAELQGGGRRLGEIGSRIVGEVFVGLLQADKHSFLSKQPDWTPTLPSATPNTFTMADLLNFVGAETSTR